MSGRVFLVMDDEDYYQRIVEAIYSTREAAEAHVAAKAAKRRSFPGQLSVEELAELWIDEEEVFDSFSGLADR